MARAVWIISVVRALTNFADQISGFHRVAPESDRSYIRLTSILDLANHDNTFKLTRVPIEPR